MQLVKTQIQHIQTLMTWCPDQDSTALWGGPDFRYPFTEQSFLEDMRWQEISSYSFIDTDGESGLEGELIGFGQYYQRLGRCHLARLAISPTQRGKGLGQRFIQALMTAGMDELQTQECSLFVLQNNARAIKSYTALNFTFRQYPDDHPDLDQIYYMVSTKA